MIGMSGEAVEGEGRKQEGETRREKEPRA